MSDDSLLVDQFYKCIMSILGIGSIKQNNLLFIVNKNLKNDYMYTCDNKQMIRADDIRYMLHNDNEKQIVLFHPLNRLKESCSHLLIDDAIHLYLRNLTYSIFRKVITTKDSTNTNSTSYWLNLIQLHKLSNPSKYTKYKL